MKILKVTPYHVNNRDGYSVTLRVSGLDRAIDAIGQCLPDFKEDYEFSRRKRSTVLYDRTVPYNGVRIGVKVEVKTGGSFGPCAEITVHSKSVSDGRLLEIAKALGILKQYIPVGGTTIKRWLD